ncbi:MFS transporter, partial [Flavobacterium bomense]|uniref:MFS transporter n=1 Tax=Flavobacterium bomense TaxID=2497483 RepID=UPI002938ED57
TVDSYLRKNRFRFYKLNILTLDSHYLLKHFNIRKLYSAGMMLSGVSMMIMMSLKTLDLVGIGFAGITMGLSFGFYWSNRDYLALAITNDTNRNYYYGLETFFYTIIAVVIPITIGWFIESSGDTAQIHTAYLIITGIVFLVTVIASIVCFRGTFQNPIQKKYVFFKFHQLWYKLLSLSLLKGLVQGFLVTAPAMLIMLLIGKEGALGTAQSIGAIIAAVIMYVIGRIAKPSDRIKIFTAGLVLFALGAVVNGLLFNQTGVIIFILLLLIAKPLMDLAYFPIQFKVIDIVSKIEKRGEFAYILNHEAGLFAGRFLGAGTFLVLAYTISTEIALRYAIVIVAVLQLSSIFVAKKIIAEGNLLSPDEPEIDSKVMKEVAEKIV